MKYSIHDYAKALDQALADPKANQQALAKNFIALVRRNGDEGRLKKILEEAGRLVRRKAGLREVRIASARPLGKTQEKTIERFVKAGDIVHYMIDPSLVAGIKVTMDDELQFDGTLKAKLEKLF
jgi:F0F1-type ATP synthase delta subunit